MIYQTTEAVIPISVILLNANETPNNGRTVTLHLINITTGVKILNGVTAPQVGTIGLYTYNWTHGITSNSTIMYYMIETTNVVATGTFRIVTDKKDLTDTIDLADGKAI